MLRQAKSTPFMKMLFQSLFIFLCCALALNTKELDSLRQAKQKALELEIYKSKEWLDLLHFGNFFNLGRKGKSEIASPHFFLSKNGKKDPKAELLATIEGFYQDIESVQVPKDFEEKVSKANILLDAAVTSLPRRSSAKQDYHAICRFPARFFYLDSLLGFENLPTLKCEEFEAMRNYVNPISATLIFPSAHINSPASMFGHTFLLLNSGFNSRLLSFAINYQANANENTENGLAFAFKGLLGMYPGSYSILPYYDKVKEYRDSENRDIWEFDLNLSEMEVAQMYRHIWELGDSWSYYYFFDENCSYNMLWLLEVARPSLALRKKFVYQVNPPETLFVLKNAGLITNEVFRPSKRAKILAYEKQMSYRDIRKAKKLAKDKLSANAILHDDTLSLQQKQYILESGIEMSEYRYMKGRLEHEQYTQIAHNLAQARSKLGASPSLIPPTPASPLSANQGLRIAPSYYIAHSQDSQSANVSQGIAIDFRLAYHDISDNDKGYLKGSQIEFLKANARLSLAPKTNVYIHNATILSLASFGNISPFFTPFSYRLETGFSRQFLQPNLRYYGSLGGGGSFGISQYSFMYYLLEPTFYLNERNRADFLLSNVFGLSFSNDSWWKLSAEYKFKAYTLQTFGHYVDITASANLVHNIGIFFSLEQNFLPFATRSSFNAGIRAYF